jgi:hypothetical protein
MGERNAYEVFVRYPELKRLLLRSFHRQDNIKLDLKEICMRAWTGFMRLKTEPVLSSCEHDSEPLGSLKGNFVTS